MNFAIGPCTTAAAGRLTSRPRPPPGRPRKARDCLECHGQGRYIQRACPLCGDPGWDWVNGADDRDSMACRISCGYTWTADDPGWRAQVLPGKAA